MVIKNPGGFRTYQGFYQLLQANIYVIQVIFLKQNIQVSIVIPTDFARPNNSHIYIATIV